MGGKEEKPQQTERSPSLPEAGPGAAAPRLGHTQQKHLCTRACEPPATGREGGCMAALMNPAQTRRLHASQSPKHLARPPVPPALPSEALTPQENRPVDLCRNIRPFLPSKMFPNSAREVGSTSPTLACLFNTLTIAQLDRDQLLGHYHL